MELSERQRKRPRDNARIARWADENALQTSSTTAPGGFELRLQPQLHTPSPLGRDSSQAQAQS